MRVMCTFLKFLNFSHLRARGTRTANFYIEEVKENVYIYEVDVDNYANDIINISNALQNVWNTPSEVRKINSREARKCLDKLRPENIVLHWEELIYSVI